MKAALLSCVLLLIVPALKADTVTINANGVFSRPELNFSFTTSYDWDTVADTISNMTFSQQGLDPFTFTSPDAGGANFSNGTDILQINFDYPGPHFPAFGSYPIADMDLIVPVIGGGQTTLLANSGSLTVSDPPPTDTPEPTSGALLLLGFPLLWALRRYSPRASSLAEQG